LIPGTRFPASSVEEPPDAIDWKNQPEPKWSARWSCAIRDLVVSFAIEPAQLVPTVRTLFQHLEVEGAPAVDTRFEIRATSTNESALIQDGAEYMRASHAGAFKDSVHKAILEKLHPGTEWLALIHGGAVARRGVGIGLPAASGSGKSTLIAYLIKNGFEYLSDDLLPITAPEGLVLPWPLPFSVKSGSWDALFPLYPELAISPVFSTKGDTARLLTPPLAAWDQEPVALRYLVFPRYDASAAAELRALSPLSVLERLLRDNVWIGHPLSKTRVEAFLLWLRSIPAFALIYRDWSAATCCLQEMANGKVSADWKF
jgi:hypothetical protein